MEGWRPLEGCSQRGSLRDAANVHGGQRPEEAERRDDSDKEKRQNRNPIRGVARMAVRDQHHQECKPDCDCRNEDPSTPLVDQFHR